MSTILRRALQALLAAALVALLASLLLAGGGSTGSTFAKSTQSVPLKDSFGILRRDAREADKMPDRWRQVEMRSGVTSAQLDEAKRVNFGASSHWIVQSQGSVCTLFVVDDAMGGGCGQDAADLAENGSFSVSGGAGFGLQKNEIRVSGLLPDGARDAHLVLADGSSVPVEVVSNVFDVVTPGDTAQFRWIDAAGEVHAQDVDAQSGAGLGSAADALSG